MTRTLLPETLLRPTLPCRVCDTPAKQMDHARIGAALRELREEKKISLREMARRLRFSTSYICDLELGHRAWSAELVKSFTEALKL